MLHASCLTKLGSVYAFSPSMNSDMETEPLQSASRSSKSIFASPSATPNFPSPTLNSSHDRSPEPSVSSSESKEKKNRIRTGN